MIKSKINGVDKMFFFSYIIFNTKHCMKIQMNEGNGFISSLSAINVSYLNSYHIRRVALHWFRYTFSPPNVDATCSSCCHQQYKASIITNKLSHITLEKTGLTFLHILSYLQCAPKLSIQY